MIHASQAEPSAVRLSLFSPLPLFPAATPADDEAPAPWIQHRPSGRGPQPVNVESGFQRAGGGRRVIRKKIGGD